MRWMTVMLILLTAGCASSPPTRYYTLAPLAASARQPAAGPSLTLQVAAVHVPALLDRQEMVRERTPERLHVSDRHRWGAPLGSMIRRVLAQDLLARLPGSVLLPPRQVPPASTRVVVLDVLYFAADPSGRVRLQGSWSVFLGNGTRPVLSAPVRLASRRPARTYAAQATAMSRLLGHLAGRIADALRSEAAQNHP